MKNLILGLFSLFLFISCSQKSEYNLEGDWEIDQQYTLDIKNSDDIYIELNEFQPSYFKIYNDTIEVINPNSEEKDWFKDGLKSYKNYKIQKNEIWIKDAITKEFQLNYYIDSITTNYVYLRDHQNERLRFTSPHRKIEFDEMIFSPISYFSGYAPIYHIKRNGEINFYNFNYNDGEIIDSIAKARTQDVEFIFKIYQKADLYYQPNSTQPKLPVMDGGGIELLFLKDKVIKKSIENDNNSRNPIMEEAIYYTQKLIEQLNFNKGNTKFKVPLFHIDQMKYRKSNYTLNLNQTESKYIYLLTNQSKNTSPCYCNKDLIYNSNYSYDFKIKSLAANNNCIELIKSNGNALQYNFGFDFFNYSSFNGHR